MNISSAKIVVLLLPLFLVSGCIDCMVRGIGARECGRIKHNAEVVENHDRKIAQFNGELKSNAAILILGLKEKEDFIRRLCTKYIDTPLPANPRTDPRVLLGLYYENHFCKIYESDNSLLIHRKEVKFDNYTGSMYFFLSDGDQVLEFFHWPVSYTDSGYKYGVY